MFTGADFDREIVVKVNLVEVLRRELARPSWGRHHVALGTNTDPYQRAEGRYRLMPGVLSALAASGTPFSVLTKGTLLRRDLSLITAAAREKLRAYGIAPPTGHCGSATAAAPASREKVLRFVPRALPAPACPRCDKCRRTWALKTR